MNALLNRTKDAINGDFNTSFLKSQFNGTNFFYIHALSLCYHFVDLHTLLARMNVKFNIIEKKFRLKKHTVRDININLNGYAIEHKPTEANCGSPVFYIDNSLNYAVKKDLAVYKKKKFEPIFIEVINPKGKNLIIDCIYRHPSMNPTEFINVYMSDLLR